MKLGMYPICLLFIFSNFSPYLKFGGSIKYQNKDDLSIEISCKATNFIRGEAQDVFVKVKNNSDKTIITNPPNNYLYDLTKDSLYSGQSGNGHIEIPPHFDYYFFDDPTDYILAGIDIYDFNLYPGNYEYYISLSSSGEEYFSNKINIKIDPVPDSLKLGFNDLRFVPGTKTSIEDYRADYKKYQGTFYDKEFLNALLSTGTYSFAISHPEGYREYRNEAINLTEKFIFKYPNSKYAYYLFVNLSYNFNENE
jgi:hypothetical protein